MKKIIFVGFFALFVACKEQEIPVQTSNLAYIVNGGSNSISILNLDNQQITDSILLRKPTGEFYAHHLSVSPDKKLLAVAIPEANYANHDEIHRLDNSNKKGGILVIDRLKKKVLAEIEVPAINFNAMFSPDGTEIWTATSITNANIYIYDSKDFKLKKQIKTGENPSELAFSKDGKYALIALTHGTSLQIIDVLKKEVIKNIKVDNQPTNVWTGKKYFFVENTDLKIVNIINAETFSGTETLNLDFFPGQCLEHPQKNELWICHTFENAITVFENSSGVWKQKQRIQLKAEPHAIDFQTNSNAVIVNLKSNSITFLDDKNLIMNSLQSKKNPNCLSIVKD